jgi:hypothetical protein
MGLVFLKHCSLSSQQIKAISIVFSSFLPFSNGSFFLIEEHVVEIILLKESEKHHNIEVVSASKFSTFWKNKSQICKITYPGRLFKIIRYRVN